MWHSHFNKLFAEVVCMEGQESLDRHRAALPDLQQFESKIWSSLTSSKMATLLVEMVEMAEERFPGDKVSDTSKYLM